MNLKGKTIRMNLVSCNFKTWLFLLVWQFFLKPKECMGNGSFDDTVNKVENIKNILISKIHTGDLLQYKEISSENENESSENRTPCHYFKSPKRLICKGLIDFAYLETMQNKRINDFIVDGFEAESMYKNKYWSKSNVKTGEWYTKLPKTYQILTGEVQLKNTGIQINVVLRMLPRKDSRGFMIEGEAFSIKVIKIQWRLKGDLLLDFIRNQTVITMNVGADGDGSDWKIQNNITFKSREAASDVDDWNVFGIIKSQYVSENQYVLYQGMVETRMMKGECRFSGEVKTKNVDLVGVVLGSVSPPKNKQITIPKSAFSKMFVKNIVFKDSHFFNDFDKNSFEGLEGVETITFINSKLEVMPRLGELFNSFSNLKEIYIEDCMTPWLKFGGSNYLKNVQSISLKGSGPLNFDDLSFMWLKNSNLTSLNLRNSHITISVKAKSAFWIVNNTLRYLDISYSTLKDEKDLSLILGSLSLVNLKAEGLQLRKIPTNALSKVKKTLEYLSLRDNNFKKSLEKHMFDNIFNFPYMPELRELNLDECHINYIERGAFDKLPNLKVLHMRYNNFQNLQDGWTSQNAPVRYLDLSHNGLSQQIPFSGTYNSGNSMNLSVLQSLEVLDLSNGIFTNTNRMISSLGTNIRNLSLRNIGIEDFSENIFQNLVQLESLDMSHNRNIKTINSFSFSLFRDLKKLKWLNLRDCRISNPDVNQDDYLQNNNNSDTFLLDNLEYLDLSVNNIKILDTGMLKAFPKLKVLNLSGNSVTAWKTSFFSFMESLEILFLDENKIEMITTDMFSDIRKLKYIKMGNNPFICGSYVYEVLKIVSGSQQLSAVERNVQVHWQPEMSQGNLNQLESTNDFDEIYLKRRYNLIKNIIHNYKENKEYYTVKNKGVFIADWSDTNYICFSWSQEKFIPFTWVNETFDGLDDRKTFINVTALQWLPVILFVGVVMTVVIICWKWLDVHLITRAVRNAVALSFLGRGEKEPSKYEYDVFVSYSDKDRSWIVDNLIPQLDSWNDVKVCLHERDFQVGLSIMENIIASIDSSKNIILVVSQSFLKSQWCQYEMHLAQHRLLEKGRDQLILIFLENIPLVKRPKTLRYLMMTKTYLEWPVNSKSQKEIEVFWNRLMKSLLKSNSGGIFQCSTTNKI